MPTRPACRQILAAHNRKAAQTSSLLRTDELARKYDIGPPSVTQALSRLERKGFVEHVNDKTYYNWLAPDGSQRDRECFAW
jgi:Mn-dependent DtxR family transcriptional regulator